MVALGKDRGSRVDVRQQVGPPGRRRADPVRVPATIVVAQVHLQAGLAGQQFTDKALLAGPALRRNDVEVGQVHDEWQAGGQQLSVLCPSTQQVGVRREGRRWKQACRVAARIVPLDRHGRAEEVGAAPGGVEHVGETPLRASSGMGAVHVGAERSVNPRGLLEPIDMEVEIDQVGKASLLLHTHVGMQAEGHLWPSCLERRGRGHVEHVAPLRDDLHAAGVQISPHRLVRAGDGSLCGLPVREAWPTRQRRMNAADHSGCSVTSRST
mmetsp:Transcript_53293/g.125140  ORF Transcript_53293/g.125140 Transcript_53293/m.125140 type:complete len:268 (-) Transcript_53293:4692-5495(-)